MKIKKKEFSKRLNDNYWRGVRTGMNVALNNPKEARECLVDKEKFEKLKDGVEGLYCAMYNAMDSLKESLKDLKFDR